LTRLGIFVIEIEHHRFVVVGNGRAVFGCDGGAFVAPAAPATAASAATRARRFTSGFARHFRCGNLRCTRGTRRHRLSGSDWLDLGLFDLCSGTVGLRAFGTLRALSTFGTLGLLLAILLCLFGLGSLLALLLGRTLFAAGLLLLLTTLATLASWLRIAAIAALPTLATRLAGLAAIVRSGGFRRSRT